MAIATLRKEVNRLKEQRRQSTPMANPLLDRLRQDPSQVLSLAGLEPDPWQTAALRRSSERLLILASRQVGKSLTAGALALLQALLFPGSLILLLSPTLRQSGELFRDKVMRLYNALGQPLAAENESSLRLELSNGSRIVSLPGSEATVRGFASVSMLIVDEAARVPDSLYLAIRPMLAVSQGRLVCLSTAWARQGFFFDAWTDGGPDWQRVQVRATECRRIPPSFLAEERRVLGPRWFGREYECQFTSADDAVFDFDSVKAAMTAGGAPPLF